MGVRREVEIREEKRMGVRRGGSKDGAKQE
jgi:hypothetical protein